MASSVQILCPNGHRQNVKVTPNTKILQILEEVCLKKGFLPPEDYELRHGRTTLDVTLALRFANLVNNAKLELVKAKKSRAETSVVIALQLATGTRLQHTFSPGVTLWDILLHWENQPNSEHSGKLAVMNGDQHPVCIYMRDEIIGEVALKATTLKKLGLTGGKAIIRLLHRSVDEETLFEIKRQLDAEMVKQEQLLSRSLSAESMNSVSATSSKSTQEMDTIQESNSDVTESHQSVDSVAMDTESLSPVAKHPRLQAEPMEEEAQGIMNPSASSSSGVQNAQSANRHLDELSNIPGVEIFRPGEPVKLSNEEQQMVHSLAQAIQPHIIQNPRAQSSQSVKPGRSNKPPQPPVPFKFPESSKGKDLYRNDLSASIKKEYEPCDRETVVYSLEEPVQHDSEYGADLPDDFFDVTVADLKRLMAEKIKTVDNFEEKPLMTKTMQQSLMEEKLSRYERVVIRVQFPDKMVLQGLFRPRETVYAVEKFVKDHLQDKSIPLYLYTAPPKCVLKDKACTLIEAKLVPASLIYFGTEKMQGGSFLSSAVAKESSSRQEADKVVLKSLPSENPTTSEDPVVKSSKKGGQPKKSSQNRVDYPSSNSSTSNNNEGKKLPKWFAAGLKK